MATQRTAELRRMLALSYPWVKKPFVVGAPMRILAGPQLAVAVSAAGGLGFMGPQAKPDGVLADLDKARELIEASNLRHPLLPIGVGFQVWNGDLKVATSAVEKHQPCAVWLFAPKNGQAELDEWTVSLRKVSPDTKIWIQVGTLSDAIAAINSSAPPDVLVVQGSEAGGHGMAKESTGTIVLFPEVADAVNARKDLGIPVVAAGGIIDGRGAAAAFSLGAAAVAMGTRFLASSEARITKGYQDEVVRASDGAKNTLRTHLYNHLRGTFGWPDIFAPRTLINRSWIDHEAGVPFEKLQALHDEAAKSGDAGWGPEGRLATYVGAGVGLVRDVKDAGVIVEEPITNLLSTHFYTEILDMTLPFNQSQALPRQRIRQLIPDLRLGKWPTGPLNSITDVPGVLAHTESIHSSPHSKEISPDINTGVTVILPRPDWYKYASFAGVFSFNGCGEMTSTHWLNETGQLHSPIVLTTTSAVGDAYRGIWEYTVEHHSNEDKEPNIFLVPTVAETYDGYLNDQSRFAVTPQHIVNGIKSATAEAVQEGSVGGGTGMMCHRFKGGTGSSSRSVKGYDHEGNEKSYTVGVLVQANYGSTENLHIGGVPVGQILKEQANQALPSHKPGEKEPRKDGSIIIIVATDAPLLPIQLQRLAKRATVGLAKVGGYGNNTSGDIFLAFSNANKIPFSELAGAKKTYEPQPHGLQMSDNFTIDGLFEAAADATEEAIYNALCMAETMVGFKERRVEALDLARVKEIVEKRL
ncbi:hypothetical protein MKX08_009718 [Trichoderma sp. CBMAI-0020]|nr:hypothetical protein MKX08_009718 [Trichoderma sp. CBMAI-0020]